MKIQKKKKKKKDYAPAGPCPTFLPDLTIPGHFDLVPLRCNRIKKTKPAMHNELFV